MSVHASAFRNDTDHRFFIGAVPAVLVVVVGVIANVHGAAASP